MGMTEREYIGAVNQCYILPLRKFLDGEMKTILKERSILENKRFAVRNNVFPTKFMKFIPGLTSILARTSCERLEVSKGSKL